MFAAADFAVVSRRGQMNYSSGLYTVIDMRDNRLHSIELTPI